MVRVLSHAQSQWRGLVLLVVPAHRLRRQAPITGLAADIRLERTIFCDVYGWIWTLCCRVFVRVVVAGENERVRCLGG